MSSIRNPPQQQWGKMLPKFCMKINEISTLVSSKQTDETKQTGESKKKANMNSRVSTGLDLDHVNSISSWITYDFSAICRWSLKILCIKKYCSICTAASESLHLSALLSPLLLLVDFLRCGRVFCHEPRSEEVHPQQVHSTRWSLTHTHTQRSETIHQNQREQERKTPHIIN